MKTIELEAGTLFLLCSDGITRHLPDPELRGHYVRVQPSGTKSFVAVTVDPHSGKVVRSTSAYERPAPHACFGTDAQSP
jgi:major membrane immunogen (membrane-anchored lipoprotein)